MSKVTITKKNESFIRVDADDVGILYELNEHFTFDVEGAKFTPKYKAKIWDGKISLYNLNKRTIYTGLFSAVVDFCKTFDYEVVLNDNPVYGLPNQTTNILPEDVVSYVKGLNLQARGEPIEMRDYQYKAVYESLKHKRLTVVSPTASGKSSIIYAITRYLVSELGLRVLIIVPTINLVTQMFGDFEDYSSANGYNVEENTAIVMGGYEKISKKPVVISTWQSLSTKGKNALPNSYWASYDAILVDECHQVKAMSLKDILEKATDVSYRLGFTGSLDGSKTNRLVIEGLLGKIEKVASTRELIDDGHLSDIKIKCLVLNYSKETQHLLKAADYRTEIDFLVSHDRRNKFIRNLALSLDGPTLLLYTLVDRHGQILYDLIKDKAGDRAVHYIHGGVDSDDREAVREVMENSQNCIVVASTGTMSQGVNIRNIHNLIFASPTKSVVRVLQSVGRGLRKSSGKDGLVIYDIADKISKTKTKTNFTYKHLITRLGIYTKEQFDYDIIEIPIEK